MVRRPDAARGWAGTGRSALRSWLTLSASITASGAPSTHAPTGLWVSLGLPKAKADQRRSEAKAMASVCARLGVVGNASRRAADVVLALGSAPIWPST